MNQTGIEGNKNMQGGTSLKVQIKLTDNSRKSAVFYTEYRMAA